MDRSPSLLRLEATAVEDRVASSAELRGIGPSRAPSPAQLRVLELVALGLSSREIGARLWISRQTVTYHISNLLTELGASSRAGLVARAYAVGILEPGFWPPHLRSDAPRRGSAAS